MRVVACSLTRQMGEGWQSEVVTDDLTTSIAWGDWDGDGDLDLAVGNEGQPDLCMRTRRTTLSLTLEAETETVAVDGRLGWVSTADFGHAEVAWGDWDRDGDLDLAAGACGEER